MPRCSTFISEIFSSSKFHFIGESRIYFGFKKKQEKKSCDIDEDWAKSSDFFVNGSAEEKILISD